jgi:hypothetical protein
MGYFLLGGVVLCLIFAITHTSSQPTTKPSPHQELDRSELSAMRLQKQSYGDAPITTRYCHASSVDRSASEREGLLYRKLMTMALGDKDKVERLIRYEFTRSPNANRAELIQDAIERWERDHRWS